MIKFNTREELAKFAIEYYLDFRQIPSVQADNVARDLTGIAPCFVTLYTDGELKGCVGCYDTNQPLYTNIIKNAVNAAFFDNRFRPVDQNDLQKLTIHVSCLTPLIPYQPKNTTGLLRYLKKNKPGMLIKAGFAQSLFLPEVWDELPNPVDFLSHLCLKAGLPSDFWQAPEKLQFQEFKTY